MKKYDKSWAQLNRPNVLTCINPFAPRPIRLQGRRDVFSNLMRSLKKLAR